jgi:hypothetical protein
MSSQDTDIATPAARNVTALDPLVVLDGLLPDVGLSRDLRQAVHGITQIFLHHRAARRPRPSPFTTFVT